MLDAGYPVRITGQDVERGTFSHRHAVVKKEDSESEYVPLNNLREGQALFSVFNSLLSEYAVLGFEYGYSLNTPNGLTIWEAQFGDFANGAQIIIDQFIASAEAKWGKFSGLTLLLPHGYEGQGPEHSSARLERFLQLCAMNNMRVIYPSSPASMFHALRRQVSSDVRVPLIVMTPKSLLRHPRCVSSLNELSTGGFRNVIDDTELTPGKVRRVLFCTGKIYYDLLQYRESNQHNDVAIVRIEQLYPLPEEEITAIAERYTGAELVWVQEEPKNMGAWMHLMRYDWPRPLGCISRRSSASPATGYKKVHDREQEDLAKQAFA
jgi:2-oxoglutarate dehydrogenase E1 component